MPRKDGRRSVGTVWMAESMLTGWDYESRRRCVPLGHLLDKAINDALDREPAITDRRRGGRVAPLPRPTRLPVGYFYWRGVVRSPEARL